MASITVVQPLHVAAWIEWQMNRQAVPTVRHRLAALRQFSDWLITGQVIATNPAASARGPLDLMPGHHNLEISLTTYMQQTDILTDDKGPLFRTIDRGTARLTRTSRPKPMPTR